MAEPIRQRYGYVYPTDLYNHGYGETGIDFLRDEYPEVDNIITNPPYSLANQFVLQGLAKARKKLALLVRVGFLAGQRRYKTIYQHSWPQRVYIFCERITFWPKGKPLTENGGTTEYMWMVWDKANTDGHTEVSWIEPGAEEKFSHA